MAIRFITTKYPGKCSNNWCGVRIPKGSKAIWTGRGKLMCIECNRKAREKIVEMTEPYDPSIDQEDEPIGRTYSRLDPYGAYTPDGTKIGSSCSCEDFPCCGH